jgi:ferric hydroxamate transport system permease protein
MADLAARRAVILWCGLGVLSLALVAAVIATRAPVPGDGPEVAALQSVLLWHSLLPRAAVAAIAGAALGLSGALLQRVLRNPIADASTLGIASGAHLALALATIFAPGLIAAGRGAVALAGGTAAVGIVLLVSWRRALDPVTIVLAGMVVSLVTAAVSAALVLARGDYLMSLYIWGAGALDQQNWNAVLALLPRLLIAGAVAALLVRPLAMLGLGDSTARSLGLGLTGTRALILGIAVWLAASVTAEVGIIGFIGLAAPAFARASGARTTTQILSVSPVMGAIVLSLADSSVQLLGSATTDLAPTGAATALFGGPLLLWLLQRARPLQAPSAQPASRLPRRRHPARAVVALFAALVVAGLATLMLGRDAEGWRIATGMLFSDLLAFRFPRLVAAGAAGALLGAAGVLMQRMTANPLASPEALGVSAGSGVGLALALTFTPAGPAYLIGGLAFGALVTLAVMLIASARAGFGPERLMLAGIAVGALCMAVLSTFMAQGDARAYALLAWLSGSTHGAGPLETATGPAAIALLLPPVFLLGRWLDILPLGGTVSTALGLGVHRSRLALALMAAVMTAISSFLVGPLSLVGLVAPHMARLLGFSRGRQQLAAAIPLGALVMVTADWLSRTVIFPYQIPVGLFAALIGGPYLVWLLSRRERGDS